MIRWAIGIVRRWRLRHELYNEQPMRHPALRAMQIGEIVPLKGTRWRLASIREQPIPCLIFVPLGETRASKLVALKKLRRADRILSRQETAARQSLAARASR